MSFEQCLNLVRNAHHAIPEYELDNMGMADMDRPLGLPDDKVFLETTAPVEPPYLIVRRHDDITSPWSSSIPLAYVVGLEYVISEDVIVGESGGQPLVERYEGNVDRIRQIDQLFMDQMLDNPARQYFRGTSDVQELLNQEIGRYILARTLELSADLYVPLVEALNG